MTTYENYVLTIEEQGSITKAAKKLNISQPSISMGLNSIEKKLGFSIFDRKSIPVTTTTEGGLYLRYLKKVKSLDDTFQYELSTIRENDTIEIRIGAPAAYVSSHIIPAAKEFLVLHPKCKIKIVEGQISSLINMINNGALDFFVSTTKDLPAGFGVDLLGNEHTYLCIPESDPINSKIEFDNSNDPLFPDELWAKTFIFLGKNQPLQVQVEKYFSYLEVTPSSNIEVDQVSSAVSLTSDGFGICFATGAALCSNNNYKIHSYILPDQFFLRKIYIAYMDSLFISDVHKEFIEILQTKGDLYNEA